jgi:hypothetical protein
MACCSGSPFDLRNHSSRMARGDVVPDSTMRSAEMWGWIVAGVLCAILIALVVVIVAINYSIWK